MKRKQRFVSMTLYVLGVISWIIPLGIVAFLPPMSDFIVALFIGAVFCTLCISVYAVSSSLVKSVICSVSICVYLVMRYYDLDSAVNVGLLVAAAALLLSTSIKGFSNYSKTT